jgi:DNA-binding CsgD family transcriptional regulator
MKPQEKQLLKRPLETLGIREAEERVYRWLLGHPRASAAEAARALGCGPGQAQRLCEAIESKGLATHSPERPRRYLPISPDVALEAFALRRQEDLRRARETIRELQEEAATARPREEPRQIVELITSREMQRRTFEQLHRSAREEVIGLVRPPMLISRLADPPGSDQLTQREAQARGVRYRGIVDSAFVALPGALHILQDEIETGQDIRLAPNLPFKLVLVDRRLAFVPLDPEHPASPVLLVRSSALLDALYALFETLWKRASPISFTANGELTRCDIGIEPAPSQDVKELLTLLVAGLNDKSIAHEMGISASTLNRRITELAKRLNARTRFQLGWLADRHFSNDPENR